MENVHTNRVDLEISIEWARSNPDLFATSYNDFFRDHRDGWLVSSKARGGFLTLVAERADCGPLAAKAPPAPKEVPITDLRYVTLTEMRGAELQRKDASWRIAGSLLYRLTDEPRPQNFDEINVTMASGSREDAPREARALHLMSLLEREESLKNALRWALEWIDAVPQDTLLPGMPGFDRDYVNSLLKD